MVTKRDLACDVPRPWCSIPAHGLIPATRPGLTLRAEKSQMAQTFRVCVNERREAPGGVRSQIAVRPERPAHLSLIVCPNII